MKPFVLIVFVLISFNMTSQTCLCWEGNYFGEFETPALKTFKFSNGKELMLCPPVFYNLDNDTVAYYRNFDLQDCSSKKQIESFYNELSYTANFQRDTLTIQAIADLPVGHNRTFVKMEWIAESFYFNKEAVENFHTLNRNIRKYSSQEIKQTLAEYEAGPEVLKGTTNELIGRLFMCVISGNEMAGKYFLDFENRFNVRYLEQLDVYDTYLAMLEQWKL